MITLRTAFFSGVLLLAPLVVTVWAFTQIINLIGGTFRPVFFFYLRFLPPWIAQLPWIWEILTTIIVLALVTGLGYLSRYVLGKYFLATTERVLQRIPGVSTVYNTVKQIVDTFSTQNRNLFNKVVLLEFPRPGVWVIGFLTNKAQGEPQAKTTEELWTIFVPTTPNPTSGFLVMLPRSQLVELDMTVGDGMKMIISGGAVVPPWPAPVRVAELAERE